MDAALARDADKAVTLLRNHIQDTLERTIEAIERQQATLQ
jgi:DNA-binding GntR family transcriptional regulator